MGFIDQHRWGPDFFFDLDGATATAANPQLQFFENFPGHLGAGFGGHSNNTLSVHAVNIPLSISFNQVIVLAGVVNSAGTRSQTYRFGLYSLNGSTLSLANSASGGTSYDSNSAVTNWMTLATSAAQNITPGTWYFALIGSQSGAAMMSLYRNSSIAPGNAIPGGFLMGRMTASTNAMPASMATSDLDITGSDAIRQPYIIITA